MKTITTLALALTIGFASAQKMKEAEVPAAVKTKFTSLYPKAKVEKWEKEGANYEAEFTNNKIETSVIFDAAGSLIATEIEIKV
ncbi:MAG: PepSY-like domain-containing protein, partial [Bacteroidia bacterium]|nr:PepSY-like domain-containing protein [Bacteroidia bacterium]